MSNGNEEQEFIRKALARVDRAEKYGWVKQGVVIILLLRVVYGLLMRSPSPQKEVEITVFIVVGFVVGACTAKITTLINRNTKAILQAIAEVNRGSALRDDLLK